MRCELKGPDNKPAVKQICVVVSATTKVTCVNEEFRIPVRADADPKAIGRAIKEHLKCMALVLWDWTEQPKIDSWKIVGGDA